MYAINNYNDYKEVIYSQDARHRLKVWFNNVEYEDIDNICEKLTIKSRIIPFGSKTFMLENFVSKEAELILHDIDLEDIQDQVKINIETYVNNNWVSVPMGIFNIQERPTTDKGKTTITLRDNSVKFDFNYNAQPLIENQYKVTTDTNYLENKEYYSYDNNTYTLLEVGTDYQIGNEITGTIYEKKGSATKLQILQDICTQAGVTCNIQSFIGSTDEIGIYDNSIKARQYISYLAGQGGAIPVINRLGELIFVYVNNLTTVNIPMWYVEKFQNGDKFKISRVVYESGIIKYESGTNNYDTLYLDSNNPYVSSLEQVEDILDIVDGFEINSFSTGRILGNPAIDSYDLISIYDEDTDTTYVTFACNELVYNGVLIQKFDSEISLELRKDNVTLNDPINNVKKWAKTQIDNVEAQVIITSGKVETLDITTGNAINDIRTKFDDYTPINATIELQNSVTQVISDSYTKTQIDTMLVDGTVKKVQTVSGTFDENGMTYEKTNAKSKTTINEVGVGTKKTDGTNEYILFAGYVDDNNTQYADYKGQTIVATENIMVKKYLVIGTHSRLEDYENGTGCFYLG